MLDLRKYPNGGAFLVMLLTILGTTILSTSRLPLLEQSVCRSYYLIHEPAIIAKDGSVPEMLCKDTKIQMELASLRGWAEFFSFVPGLVLTVPYGRLAETTSKKLILSFNTVSYVFSVFYFLAVCYFYEQFNIKMIWLSCLFDIIGGGAPILRTLLYTSIAEGTDPPSLSSTYYTLSASLLVTTILGMAIGTSLLVGGIWRPFQIGLLVYSLGIPALWLLPSSLPVLESGESDALLTPEIRHVPETTSVSILESSWKTYLVAQSRAATTDCTKSFHTVMDLFIHDRFSRLCLAIFFFNFTAMGVRIILQQWASKFFGWTLAETSYVLTLEMLVCSIVLISLPYISKKSLKPWLGSTQADFWVVKASLLLNIVGVLCIGLAPTKISFIMTFTVYSAGTGLYDSLRSFATGFLQKGQITRFYTGISLVEIIGGLIAGPLWTGVFSLALSVDYLGFSLPFWLCSLCFIGAFMMVVFLERYLKQAMLW